VQDEPDDKEQGGKGAWLGMENYYRLGIKAALDVVFVIVPG
jgi:hypothetical protein